MDDNNQDKHLLQKHKILTAFSVKRVVGKEEFDSIIESIKSKEPKISDEDLSLKSQKIISERILQEKIPGSINKNIIINNNKNIRSTINSVKNSLINFFNKTNLDKDDIVEVLFRILNDIDPKNFPLQED